MSAITQKSITGITSITTPAGVDNQFTLHNNNTTEAVKLDNAGNLHFHNHLNITGVSTASNFKTGTSNLHNTGLNVQDLDVDGHTNLDNVSISGVSTFSGAITANSTLYVGSDLTITDKIVHNGDTNTAIRFPEADAVTIETNGNERFRINSNGAWGIGAAYGSSGQVLTSGGSGSSPSWTTITGTTINNNTNDCIVTATGTTNVLQGESELRWQNGNNLFVRAGEGESATLNLIADQGDDNGDGWKIQSEQDENDLTFKSNISGSYVDKLKLKSNGQLEVQGNLISSGEISPSGHINLASSKKLSMASDVFKIYHSTDAAIINESGDLLINQNVSNKDIKISTGSGPTERARITSGGEFQIQHFSPPDGSSASRAARSALEIKRYYPQKTSGNYWIKDNNGTARQIYCEMETDGGGWMLWHDNNAPGSKVSMNIALGGSDASPSGNLARSNYNNYAYYTVWIRASQINATGERLHSFVQLDQDGELKYVADYGADFLYEDVGDQYQPNLNAYFNSPSNSEYVSNTQMYQPQCGATGWQNFSNGGWQEVYIREMDTRISPGDHRSLHLVDRIYGFDSNGVPIWTVSESMHPLPFWGDISLFNGEVADGNQNIIQNAQREIRSNSGNNGPASQGRSRGVFTGSFEIEFQLGQLWGWSIGALNSSIQVAANIRANVTTPYSHFTNYYSLTTGNSTPYALYSLYNNSSNNMWMPVSQTQFQAYNEQQYSGGNSGSNVIWRTDDGTIRVKCKSGSQSHGPYTFPNKFAGPLIFSSGQQGPHSTFIYDCWNSNNTGATIGGRNKWYK